MQKGSPQIRTLTAAWFLGLFLFIYAEKLLHTHLASDHINKEEAHVSSSNNCALCDFQPGKEAEIMEPCMTLIPAAASAVLVIRPASILHELWKPVFGDRGPPSLG